MNVAIDGNELKVDWDPNDPKESVLNCWTEEDFLQFLKAGCEQFYEFQELLNDSPDIDETTFEKDFLEK